MDHSQSSMALTVISRMAKRAQGNKISWIAPVRPILTGPMHTFRGGSPEATMKAFLRDALDSSQPVMETTIPDFMSFPKRMILSSSHYFWHYFGCWDMAFLEPGLNPGHCNDSGSCVRVALHGAEALINSTGVCQKCLSALFASLFNHGMHDRNILGESQVQ